jgi:hypothetical protein
VAHGDSKVGESDSEAVEKTQQLETEDSAESGRWNFVGG